MLHVFEDKSIPEVYVFNITTQIKCPIKNHALFKIQTHPKVVSEKFPKTFGIQKVSNYKNCIMVSQSAGYEYPLKEMHGCRICIT